jgi:diguanylate cyclase (GGDEF)-like protein
VSRVTIRGAMQADSCFDVNGSLKVSLDDTARIAMHTRAPSPVRARLARLTEPQLLFPLLSVLVLSILWGGTINLIRVEYTRAEATAAASTLELLNTYEAQVVRALREIDQTLKVVKYVYEGKGAAANLDDLKKRGLLPPDLLFAVSVVNSEGGLVASTHPDAAVDAGFLAKLHDSDSLQLDVPRKNGQSDDWVLHFGRRIVAANGTFSGAVLIGVDASYFVSGYDAGSMGQQGLMGLLGTDGIFRARRSGDTLVAGDSVDYQRLVPPTDQLEVTALLATNPWDNVRRYTSAQQLYDFPVAVTVGLSADEQLATVQRNQRVYLERAAIASGLLVLFATLLGRLSWQLARGRERENEARLNYAQRIEYLAYHDGLTALPNRSLFHKLLSQSISQAQRHSRQLAVAFIDLDRFKQINDTLGHEAGDQLLKEVAVRLKDCLRDSDIVARLGGDEFVVLLTELTAEHYAATVAQKIVAAIAKPFILAGQDFRVTASIGVAMYPQDGLDELTLTKHADVAMYQSKEDGRNTFQFYSEKMNENTLERLTLESSLRHALERNEFVLHYQAKRDMRTGQVTGMEALLRWQHPDLGLLTPLQFIPVAEETGLIVPIGKWVLKTACLQNLAWQALGLPRVTIAVNVSSRQFFEDQLLSDIKTTLEATGMEARYLEIEVSESLLIRDVARSLRILTGLKAMGVRIAVDDFGTGYSSLATLQHFPLDTIKIDRSYVRDLTASSESNNNLADAIIAMGKSLSLTVVAQGVETREQAEFLRAHACDELQGFYFNRPASGEQITELLQSQNAEISYLGSRKALRKP